MEQKTILLWLITLYLAVGLHSATRAADKAEWLGGFKDWDAMAYIDGERSGCYVVSKPKSEKGKYTKRGQVYVLVSVSPKITTGIVSFHAGYPFREDSDINVDIDGQKYTLLTDKETGWAYEGEDKPFIERMRSGKKMIVVGFSKRGTETTDTYSLFGFTQAYETILGNSKCY
jgi:hypothetical protein